MYRTDVVLEPSVQFSRNIFEKNCNRVVVATKKGPSRCPEFRDTLVNALEKLRGNF